MSTIELSDKIKISVQAVLWFILIVLFVISCPLVMGVAPWLVILSFVGGGLVSIPLFYLYRYLFTHTTRLSFAKFVLIVSMLNVVALASPVFYFAYSAEAHPLLMPKVVLAKGNKKVVFQGMVHVGSESFYKSVVYDLENALASDYVLFYEGVQPSDVEANQWFSNTMSGGKDLSENYQKLADICGVQFQLNFFTLLAKQQQENPLQHITADVSTRQLLDEWSRLIEVDPSLEKQRLNNMQDPQGVDVMSWLQTQSDKRKKIGGIFCRALLSNALRIPQEGGPLSPIILDFRNKNLAHTIASNSSENIYVTYGAAHLSGLVDELQAIDPAWQIVSVKWVRALESDRTYLGDSALYLPQD